jgi:hypothetical protein
MVTSGVGVPPLCPRHGEAAAIRRRTVFVSRPPGWVYLLLLLCVVPFVVVAVAMRRTLVAAGWPFCARCRRRRRRLYLIAAGLFLLGMAVIISSGPIARGRSPWWGLLVVPGDLIATFGPMIALFLSPPAVIARGHVTRDGRFLQLRKAAPAFVAALPAVPPPPPPAPGGYGR